MQDNQLTDDQVREFITNGFLVIQPDVHHSLHSEIDSQIRFIFEYEGWYGNNIGARIPQLFDVVRSPRVNAALTALAGPDYLIHPHRAIHRSTPVGDSDGEVPDDMDGPRMGKGSNSGSGWHQDAQSPLARARHHLPRYLIGFYFPHDTPALMGTTRVQAGSYLYANPEEPRDVVLPEYLPGGSFVIVHFDMVHAGFPNRSDQDRYMVKFVFTRTREPDRPYWQNLEPVWKRPQTCIPKADGTRVWSYIWYWLRGDSNAWYMNTSNISERPVGDDPWDRLNTIYGLASSEKTEHLIAALLQSVGQNKHTRRLVVDDQGREIARDDTTGFQRRWNERAIAMEDVAYGLSACGESAVPALTALLGHNDPWITINAAFALGEIGPMAISALPSLVQLLDDSEQTVVRQALDALSSIGTSDDAISAVGRLLSEDNPSWQVPQVTRGWTAQDQIRMNAVSYLLSSLSMDPDVAQVEELSVLALDDPCGYVNAIAIETLRRIGSQSALESAVNFLCDHRFDSSLRGRLKPY